MESRVDRAAKRRKRRLRYRHKLTGTSTAPRLSVIRSLKHIYVQAIDDAAGRTVASASTQDKDVRSRIKTSGNVEAAKIVGETIAAKLKDQGVETVKFDRGGYMYHGRIKAVAQAAREKGLKF